MKLNKGGSYAVMQLCSYAVMQLCSYAVMQLCSYAVMQSLCLTITDCCQFLNTEYRIPITDY